MGRYYECYAFSMALLFCVWLQFPVLARPSSSTDLPTTRHFHFNVEWKNVTRLCHTKRLLTVNGQYPGPTIQVHEGDEVVIKVTNRVSCNTTIHWHGIRQFRTGWADGPAYITQCPIQCNESYTYRFRVEEQRGTLLWHSHLSWQRASVHGAFIILPRSPYPFTTPIQADIPIILGEWWNGDVEAVEADTIMYGGGPNVSDAYTINGLPGPLYDTSSNNHKDTFEHTVEHGKTYMLRLINAALNCELFFAIANHTLTVVEADALYVKPFVTPAIMIAPGQTTTVLLTADHPNGGTFLLAARPYVTAVVPFDNTTAIGFIHYSHKTTTSTKKAPLILPHNLPPLRDTDFATKFTNKLRSLGSDRFPCKVPKVVDREVFLTISLNLQDCCTNCTCKGFHGKRFAASINNQSFVRPPVSILESYYKNPALYTGSLKGKGFPEKPLNPFNYTGSTTSETNMNAEYGTKLLVVPYGERVELVLQDTSFINVENHPIHVHGHNFFVVGSGVGNFEGDRDRKKYNLVDPPERNTVAVPSGGWAAIRLKADNPGIWFVHCHLEVHTTWGLAMGFVVENGLGASQSILPPPKDLPRC